MDISTLAAVIGIPIGLASVFLAYLQVRQSRERKRHALNPAHKLRSGIHTDMATAPHRGRFYGRKAELDKLLQALQSTSPLAPRGVISLVGEAGIGKSRLAVETISRLSEDAKLPYDVIMWRTLKEGLPLQRVLADLISNMSKGKIGSTGITETDLAIVSGLAEGTRVLLVLDNIESILMTGVLAGKVMHEFSDYISLISLFAQTGNQCSLLIAGREMPSEITMWQQESGTESYIEVVRIGGLDEDAGREMLAASTLPTHSESVERLLTVLGSNPMKLRIAGPLIAEIYSGNISEFLGKNNAASGELGDIVANQLKRISPLENTILFWLALERIPIPADILIDDILWEPAKAEVGAALASLIRRNLCERTQAGLFTVQPAVAEYLTSNLIERIVAEITASRHDLLNSFGLYSTKSPEYVNAAQLLYVLHPLIDHLSGIFSREQIPRKLQALCSGLSAESRKAPGYLAGNVLNIIGALNTSLTDVALSGFEIRNADLRLLDLKGIDLRGVRFLSCRFSTRLGNVHTCAVVPSTGDLAVGGTSGEISLMRQRDMVKVATLRGHVDWVRAIIAHPTLPHLVSASDDGTLRVWDLTTGLETARLTGHRGRVIGAAYGQGGLTVLSIGEDGFLREWDYGSWILRRAIQIQREPLISIATSSDGSIIALAGETKEIKILDGLTWHEVGVLSGHAEWVTTLAISGDNKLLVSGSLDSSVRLWDLSRNCLIKVLHGPMERVWCVAIKDDGAEVASGYGSGIVTHWRLQREDADETRTLHGHRNRVWSVLFVPSSHELISCGEGQTIRVWDIESGECIRSSDATESQMCSIDAIAADRGAARELLVVTGGEDRQVRTWVWSSLGVEIGAVLKGHEGRVWSVLAAEGPRLITGSEDGTVREWIQSNDVWGGRTIIDLDRQIYNIEWAGSDRQTVAVADESSRIVIVEIATGDILSTLTGHEGLVWTMCASPSTQHLASASFDGTVGWWNIEKHTMEQRFRMEGAPMLGVAIPRSAEYIVSADYSGTVGIWDLHDGMLIRKFEAHAAPIWGVSISPSGQVLATGAADGTIALWDLPDASLRNRLRGHKQWLGRVRFYNEHILASVGTDGSGRLWDTETNECIGVMRPPRVYEGLDIRGCSGLSPDDIAVFEELGARTDSSRGAS